MIRDGVSNHLFKNYSRCTCLVVLEPVDANHSSHYIINQRQKQPPRGVLRKRCSGNMQQIYRRTPCWSVISIKLLCNFIEITLRHGCSPLNLLHIFKTPFTKNISGWLLLHRVFKGSDIIFWPPLKATTVRIWSHLPKKSVMENFIFRTVHLIQQSLMGCFQGILFKILRLPWRHFKRNTFLNIFGIIITLNYHSFIVTTNSRFKIVSRYFQSVTVRWSL